MTTGKVVETPSERHPHAPYRQSQRKPIYRKYAEQLVAAGKAYYAFDSAEELDERRKSAEAAGETFIYNQKTRLELRNSLTLPAEETERLLRETTDWTIRFKMPENTVIKMDDLIRGHIEMNTDTLDDKVLWKRADELPTYHLANIVDDHLMEITEVIRGEEWLPSLPLHYQLYEAFGWTDTMPRFAHLSLLLKPVGNGKLSKRDGDKMGFPVFPLQWVSADGTTSHGYREDGYFPEAFVNMLALLGWNPGDDRELFTMEELIQAFSMEKVQKAGAKFNPEKAKWFNKEYLRLKSDGELTDLFLPVLSKHGITGVDRDYALKVVSLIKERASFVEDFWTLPRPSSRLTVSRPVPPSHRNPPIRGPKSMTTASRPRSWQRMPRSSGMPTTPPRPSRPSAASKGRPSRMHTPYRRPSKATSKSTNGRWAR